MAKMICLQNKQIMDMEDRLYLPGGRGSEWVDWESGISKYKLLHLEWLSNEILLCSTGYYIQSLLMEHDRGWCEKKNVYVCVCVCVCVYNWVTLVCNRNWQSIVNQLLKHISDSIWSQILTYFTVFYEIMHK